MIIMRGMRGKILVNGPKLVFTTHPISFKDVLGERDEDLEWLYIYISRRQNYNSQVIFIQLQENIQQHPSK
jgi:hypothetical protein